jgi:ribosomal protein S27E
MAYLHCPHCRRTAWLHAGGEPGLRCRHCEAALTPMPGGQARLLVTAVRARFALDARTDASRRRFVRD